MTRISTSFLPRSVFPLSLAALALFTLPRGIVAQNSISMRMLVPGFRVDRLPLDLTNINNVLCRPDGQLLALAYNGNIWKLRDANGDGLEDTADLFWKNDGTVTAPVGMDLTADGHGVYFSVKGKVMLVEDGDHDGVAEKTTVLAEGWPPARAGVDTTSVVRDPKDGSVWFGLGVRWYDNAYEIDPKGVAHNDLTSERGAILRIAPDGKSREKICTGVRWPIAMRFNAAGDLFCTDQEGATWLSNGNPTDELLHIERSKHYGFPPQHPKHLPNVVDEPSVAEYTPQHQSACGLNFIEPVAGGKLFGPAWWQGSALVTGETRGKLWRTSLVKSSHGYISQTDLIASISGLAVDTCVTKDGAAVLTAHSGPPDWGTGPEGKGALFKIRPLDGDVAPQPVVSWLAGEKEIRIAFDQPVSPDWAGRVATQARLETGPHVRPGDRLEVLRPPYEVVRLQQDAPKRLLKLSGAHLSDDKRTLSLDLAEPQSVRDAIAIQLPGYKADESSASIDLGLDGTGVYVLWEGADGRSWKGCLPHLDLVVSQQLTEKSAEPQQLWAMMAAGGTLTLKTRLDLWRLLQSNIQEGAELDFDYTDEVPSVTFASRSGAFTVTRTDETPLSSQLGQITHDVTLSLPKSTPEPVPVKVILTVAKETKPHFEASWATQQDKRQRAFPRRRLVLPWAAEATPLAKAGEAARLPQPEARIKGGDWARGREIFFSDMALCGKCHTVRGQGRRLGPDLSNLTQRDYDGVFRDIKDPNAVLNPDHLTQEVTLKSGEKLIGVIRDEGGPEIVLGTGPGLEQKVAKATIASSKPLAASLMPAGLDMVLGPERLRDLMTFLLTAPPLMGTYSSMPRDGVDKRPRKRTAEEVQAVIGTPVPLAGPLSKKRLILVAGPKDHGVGEHDYPRWQRVWGRLLGLAENLEVQTAWIWPSAEQMAQADALLFFRKGDWSADRAQELDAFLARGGGATFLHWAVEAGPEASGLAQRLGLASNSALTKYRHGVLTLDFSPNSTHPITQGFAPTTFHDESYWALVGDPSRMTLLATAVEENQARPLVWVREEGQGRLVGNVLGHYSWTFDDPLFRVLVFRSLAWSMKEPIERFYPLVKAGVE